MSQVTFEDVQAAAIRIRGHVRSVPVARAGTGTNSDGDPFETYFALEFMQHTGSFKARGAQNFIRANREAGTLPEAGVTIASGGNAGLACAWAAQHEGIPATVFLPTTAPQVKVDRLRTYGADVRLIGAEYAEARIACDEFAADSGALASHAYDHPLIAAGAGTVMAEFLSQQPQLDTVVVAVGGGGLFAGVAAVARHHGIRTVAVEPENCRALNAAVEADAPVDVPVDSVAADSLGARRASALALDAAQHTDSRSILVPDQAIIQARHDLWNQYRLGVEHAAATTLAAARGAGDYAPRKDEKVGLILCGANTDVSDL
ncbi:threonine/serine dehydratase [Arthrobacter castelli]|uniref:threonine/serine dehydratase n=1 Tax=Arthrobacter castelli TaxID=271431 RepID=UPI0004022900|nr:threonine/serine dehydratase [Arthrobacter castelli]